MNPRKYAISVFALAAAFILSSCAPTPAADPNAITIMGKRDDMEKTYMTRIFDLYREKTGKNLNLVKIEEDSEFEKIASARFASGKDEPDILLHFHNADLNRFDVGADFYDLRGEDWVSDLTDEARDYCTDAEGRVLGLPFWESSVSGCYYNKTILDKCGMRAATTQKEFDALCAGLMELGYTPICWPGDGCGWMAQFGLDPIFADDPSKLARLNAGELAYADIPEVHRMMSWLSSAAEKGWFGDRYTETGGDDIDDVMNSGGAVMTFIWDTWFYTDMQPGKYTVEDFALMPVFMNTVAGGTYEGGNLNMMMVNKESEKREEALAFLEFCASPENYNAAFKDISTVASFKGMTSNIQSAMVTDARASLAAKQRVSTASTKIIGYSQDDVAGLIDRLLRGQLSVEACVKEMDRLRIAEAEEQGLM